MAIEDHGRRRSHLRGQAKSKWSVYGRGASHLDKSEDFPDQTNEPQLQWVDWERIHSVGQRRHSWPQPTPGVQMKMMGGGMLVFDEEYEESGVRVFAPHAWRSLHTAFDFTK